MTDATKPPQLFERVPNTGAYYPQVHRIPVPGGWIYYIEPSHREPCAVFVPDPVSPLHFHLQPNHTVERVDGVSMQITP